MYTHLFGQVCKLKVSNLSLLTYVCSVSKVNICQNIPKLYVYLFYQILLCVLWVYYLVLINFDRYIVCELSLCKSEIRRWAQWCIPLHPSTREADTGGPLWISSTWRVPGQLRLQRDLILKNQRQKKEKKSKILFKKEISVWPVRHTGTCL